MVKSLTGILVKKLARDGSAGGVDRYPRHYSGPCYLAPLGADPLGADRFADMELTDSTPARPTMSRPTKAILRRDPAEAADRCSHVVEASSAWSSGVRNVAKCPHGDIRRGDTCLATGQAGQMDSAIQRSDSGRVIGCRKGPSESILPSFSD